MLWPGEIENAKAFAPPSITGLIEDFNHVLEADVVKSVFATHGFKVEYCGYYMRPGSRRSRDGMDAKTLE